MSGSINLSGMSLKEGTGGGGSGSGLPGANEFWVDSQRVPDKPNRIFASLPDVFSDITDGIPSKDTTNEDWVVVFYDFATGNITEGFLDRVKIRGNSKRAELRGNVLVSGSTNGTPIICDCTLIGDITFENTSKLELNNIQAGAFGSGPSINNTNGGALSIFDSLMIFTDITNASDTGATIPAWVDSTFLFGSLSLSVGWAYLRCTVLGVTTTLNAGSSIDYRGGVASNITFAGTDSSAIKGISTEIDSFTFPNATDMFLQTRNCYVHSCNFENQPGGNMEFIGGTMGDNDFTATYNPAGANTTLISGVTADTGNVNNTGNSGADGSFILQGSNIISFTSSGMTVKNEFTKVVSIVSDAAGTPIPLIPNAEVDGNFFISEIRGQVKTADLAGFTALVFKYIGGNDIISFGVANLTNGTYHTIDSSNVSANDLINGGSSDTGVELVGNQNGTGSGIFEARVEGYILKTL